MPITRRRVLMNIACAGVTARTLLRPSLLSAAEGALETKSLTLANSPALCTAPQFIAEELLREEGFTEIKMTEVRNADLSPALGSGKIDFAVTYASLFATGLDNGAALTLLAGVMGHRPKAEANRDVRCGEDRRLSWFPARASG